MSKETTVGGCCGRSPISRCAHRIESFVLICGAYGKDREHSAKRRGRLSSWRWEIKYRSYRSYWTCRTYFGLVSRGRAKLENLSCFLWRQHGMERFPVALRNDLH